MYFLIGFVGVCYRSPLLSAEEQTSLLVHLVGNSPSVRRSPSGGPSDYINWAQMARPRVRCPPHYLPISSSQGAGRCEGSPCKSSKARFWRWWPCRKQKQDKPSEKQKKKKETKQQQDKSDKPICCSSTCDYLIILIACLFD